MRYDPKDYILADSILGRNQSFNQLEALQPSHNGPEEPFLGPEICAL